MAEGDVLHMLIKEEVGVTADIRLVSGGTTDNTQEVPDAPVALSASDITSNSFTANWHFMENTSGYYLDVATDEDFTAFVAGYEDLDVGYVNEYSIVGLLDAYTYYYRLRGYNDVGTGVNSNIISLTTEMELVVDFDGNIYTYVTIGTQQWLIENLITTHYDDGVAIPNLPIVADWQAENGTVGHDGAYVWYDSDQVTYGEYGCLYNWYAVNNAHGLAMAGWRVPTSADLTTLITFLGGTTVAGGKLKEIGFGHWLIPNTNATDEYGFTALPSGVRLYTGTFDDITERNWIWSATQSDALNAYMTYLRYNSGGMVALTTTSGKRYGMSIRLMRDI